MSKSPQPAAYDADLAYIHDAGFGSFAEAAATFLREHLRERQLTGGRIVELGCGSGIQAAEMLRAGYDVVGYDISLAMVELARRRAPQGAFHAASFLDAKLPPCDAVTAIGEIFNYLFDTRNSAAALTRLFRRVYAALEPGGTFLFDVALVGRIPDGTRRTYVEHADWACLYEGREDPRRHQLERHITTFRREGDHYRRSHELHRLRIYDRGQFLAPLRQIGFRVRTLAGYGPFRFPPGYQAYLCRK